MLNTVINKQFNPPTYPAYFMGNDKEISEKQDIANGQLFLQMLDPILQNKLLYVKSMFLFLIIWVNHLIKVCF